MSDEARANVPMQDKLRELGLRYLIRTADEVAALQRVLSDSRGREPLAVAQLAKAAHRIHGSGAMLGFQAISDCAGLLDAFMKVRAVEALNDAEFEQVNRRLAELAAIIRAAQRADGRDEVSSALE